ncbi:hypothetical protein C7212DRAFT_343364 [Tuber magnatum]|uniref:Uncharacterized protein n=1 Tax=Tuber magnatum TaxID=42249 RepID=A0A317SXK0_9PEZI|nr:hypothetical protein C7212DRAFT_343364 [Tuber magnatum]
MEVVEGIRIHVAASMYMGEAPKCPGVPQPEVPHKLPMPYHSKPPLIAKAPGLLCATVAMQKTFRVMDDDDAQFNKPGQANLLMEGLIPEESWEVVGVADPRIAHPPPYPVFV